MSRNALRHAPRGAKATGTVMPKTNLISRAEDALTLPMLEVLFPPLIGLGRRPAFGKGGQTRRAAWDAPQAEFGLDRMQRARGAEFPAEPGSPPLQAGRGLSAGR